LLQPMQWKNDWPVIGSDPDRDGVGEPVNTYKKPNVGATFPIVTPPESDEFNGNQLGLHWQWHANPQLSFGFPSGNLGFLRLNSIVHPESDGLWEVPNLLLQKFPAEEFTATTKLTFNTRTPNEEVGFVVMGEDYQFISLRSLKDGLVLRTVQCKNARTGGEEVELFSEKTEGNEIYFRVKVEKGAVCSFSYSVDGKKFKDTGPSFNALPGRWIGAKIGYFALREEITNDAGTVDIDWFRIE